MNNANMNSDFEMIPTGFNDIDIAGSMLRRGKLTVVAGRPLMGRTDFALNLASRLIDQGRKVCYISLEIFASAITERLAKIRGSYDFPGFSMVYDCRDPWNYTSDFVSSIRHNCGEPDVVIIDSLSQMETYVAPQVMESFPNAAFLVILKVSPKVDEREDHRPQMQDILGLENLSGKVYCAATIYKEGSQPELTVHAWDGEPVTVTLSI